MVHSLYEIGQLIKRLKPWLSVTRLHFEVVSLIYTNSMYLQNISFSWAN